MLRGGKRKTADIIIERDGHVSVRAPAHLSEEQADAVVESRRLWIYRNLAEWQDLNVTRRVREWTNGEGFLYLGSSYRLLLVQEQDEPVKLKDGRFCLLRKIVENGRKEAARHAFERFYSGKGLERIRHRAAYFSPKVGVTPRRPLIFNIKRFWTTQSWEARISPPCAFDDHW